MHFTFDHVWQGLLTLVAIVLGWLHLSRRDESTALKRAAEEAAADAEEARRDLEKHKLFAAETYVRKSELDAMETRLRGEIKEQGQRQLGVLEEIRDRLPARR